MPITRHYSESVINHHDIAITRSLAGEQHSPVGGRHHAAPVRSGYINSGMVVRHGWIKRIVSATNPARDVSFDRQEQRPRPGDQTRFAQSLAQAAVLIF